MTGPAFSAPDPGFREKVSASFNAQSTMHTLGMSLARVEPGEVDIDFAHAPHICQQHGFIHGGVMAAALDTACGFAALSLMPAGSGVLTVEFKMNCLSPGKGERFRAQGRVRKAGRTITLVEADLFGETGGQQRLVATMTATMIRLDDRDDVRN